MNRLRQPNKMRGIVLFPAAALALNACGASHDTSYSFDAKDILTATSVLNHYEMSVAKSDDDPKEVTLTIIRTPVIHGEPQTKDTASVEVDLGCKDGQIFGHNLKSDPSGQKTMDELQIGQEIFKITRESTGICLDGIVETKEVLLPLTGSSVAG